MSDVETFTDAESGLELRVTCDAAPSAWDARVLAVGGTVFHGTPWARVIVAHGRSPWYLEFGARGREVGFAIAQAARSRIPFIGRARSHLGLQTTPVLAEGVQLGTALRLVRSLARKRGFGQCEFGSFGTCQPGATGALRDLGWPARPRVEFSMPLQPDLDATLVTMSTGHRRNIRKAMAAGFRFREDSSIDGAMRLRRLQESTYGRRWEQGNTSPQPMDEAYYRRTTAAYLAASAMRFWFVERDGEPLSGLGVLVYGVHAYYLVGGTSAAGYESRAAFAAFGHAIAELCAAGVHELHLGGVPAAAELPGNPDHGLYRFKGGFGAVPVVCWDAAGPT